jgi:hypothetical protein
MLSKILLALALAALGHQQTTPDIDLTGVVPKNRIREPLMGSSSGGLVGQSGNLVAGKDSVQVILLSVESSGETDPHLTFEIQIQNRGGEALEFPADPNLADFEPKDASISYVYELAYVALFADLKGRGSRFLPGLSLYGSEGIKGTMKRVNPGESVRIRGRVSLNPIGTGGPETIPPGSPVKAALLMQRASVSQKDGVLNQSSEQLMPQIASSNSIPFSLPR